MKITAVIGYYYSFFPSNYSLLEIPHFLPPTCNSSQVTYIFFSE